MTAFSAADLTALGYRVVDGRAVRVSKAEELGVAPPKSTVTSRAVSAPTAPYRSKWEAERAAVLDVRKRAGSIADWRYEGIRLKLADGAWYKPDFMIVHNSGFIELEEVKGHWREAAKVRWKVAVEQYPMFSFRLLTKEDGAWRSVEYHGRAA